MKRTTIIATLGPASSKIGTMEKLVRAGADVFRVNFSHGEHSEHEKTIQNIRKVEKKTGQPIPVLMDLQGPKIRVGQMPGDGVLLKPGAKVTIVTKNIIGTENVIPTSYKKLPADVKKGDFIMMNDGWLGLQVISTNKKDAVECKVKDGGLLKSHKGINLPGVPVSAPSLTKKDLEDLEFGIGLGVDFVAMSFVRQSSDIVTLKKRMKKLGANVPIVAKIERPEALDHIEAIIDEADLVMVARGDLGVEMPPEQVPTIQKRIIEMANQRGRGVVTATQMLESMIDNPRPTRAEASDVANSVLDGTGAVMLSGETAVGKYPVQAVKIMSKILEESEKRIFRRPMLEPSEYLLSTAGFSGAVAHSAARIARELGAKAILTFTQSGTTAMLVSKYRPCCPVFGATMDAEIARRMSMLWGVIPVIFKKITNTESLVGDVDEILLKSKQLKKGDTIVITSGVPIGKRGTTNFLKIHRMGEMD